MAVPPPLAQQTARSRACLKRRLERLYRAFDRSYLGTDPLAFVHRYDSEADQEMVGFLASGLAFGNVLAIRGSVSALLAALGNSPHAFVDGFDPARNGRALDGLYHRWVRSSDLVLLLETLRRMRAECGSIGSFFMAGYRAGDEDIGPSLASFSKRARELAESGTAGRGSVASFFPSPDSGSACKRLNLFLRWMVRDGDGLDLGLWPGVSRGQLVLPLDTHLVRLCRVLGLTRRRTPGWKMAVEATRSLALLDPNDPVKYDFSLSRLGILDLCLHGREPVERRSCGVPRLTIRRRRSGKPELQAGR